MKKHIRSLSLIHLAVATLALHACKTGPTASGLAGTYVNDAQSEASIVHDTLVVEQGIDRTWLLHRKTGFRLVVNGKAGKELHESEEWTAVPDDKTGVLTESKHGKLIAFPDARCVTVGKRLYRRLN